MKKIIFIINYILFYLFLLSSNSFSDNHNFKEILEIIQNDIKTLEKAVYSESKLNNELSNNSHELNDNAEDVLTRHLLKLSEIETQFQNLTNRFEEINFKIDKLSTRLSKVQSDNQLRFQQLEKSVNKNISTEAASITSSSSNSSSSSDPKLTLPGTSEPQDLGSISYKDMTSEETNQETQSIDTTASVVTENFIAEEKILPQTNPQQQYEFATSFLKVGDYNTAERAFREFVNTNPDHKLAGNAQYWYAETFRIRQLYTDAASDYLEGYKNYPKSDKAPINLLKLGVSLVQIGEKDQGCLMISGVKKQYPNAKESVIQKAKYEEKKFECKKNNS